MIIALNNITVQRVCEFRLWLPCAGDRLWQPLCGSIKKNHTALLQEPWPACDSQDRPQAASGGEVGVISAEASPPASFPDMGTVPRGPKEEQQNSHSPPGGLFRAAEWVLQIIWLLQGPLP